MILITQNTNVFFKGLIINIEFFLKPKKTGMSSPYHQDNFYWNILSAKALNIWIACSEANENNGGVCYLEGSHLLGTINHEISFAKGSSQKITKNLISKLLFKKILKIKTRRLYNSSSRSHSWK